MGTTLTAVGLVNEDGQDVLALVNVGDSRSYRFHDGELTQITTDHSLAEEMVRTGELTTGRGGRPPPPPHPDPGPRRVLGRGGRPVADPTGARRPVPAVQRRPDQRARARSDQRGPVLGDRSPAGPPTCWSRRPGPTGAATTSRWWWSTSWWVTTCDSTSGGRRGELRLHRGARRAGADAAADGAAGPLPDVGGRARSLPADGSAVGPSGGSGGSPGAGA